MTKTIHYAPFPPELMQLVPDGCCGVSSTYSKIDNRHSKRYEAKVFYHFPYLAPLHPSHDPEADAFWSNFSDPLSAAVRTALKAAPVWRTPVGPVAIRFSRENLCWRPAEGYGLGKVWKDRGRLGHPESQVQTVGIMFTFAVPRPSLIPCQEDARAFLQGLGLDERLSAILDAAVAAYAEAVRAAEHTHQANTLGGYLVNQIQQQAKGIVRYEQRLAALKAELAAECEAQVPIVLAEWDAEAPEGWCWSGEEDDVPIDPRVVKAVRDRGVKICTHDLYIDWTFDTSIMFTKEDLTNEKD
jgi:hypothetical protein